MVSTVAERDGFGRIAALAGRSVSGGRVGVPVWPVHRCGASGFDGFEHGGDHRSFSLAQCWRVEDGFDEVLRVDDESRFGVDGAGEDPESVDFEAIEVVGSWDSVEFPSRDVRLGDSCSEGQFGLSHLLGFAECS